MFWWKHRSLTKEGRSWTEYINEEILSSHVLWMLGLIVLINVSEGVYAASIPDKGGAYINGVARFFAHISISLVSAFLMISAPLLMIQGLQATHEAYISKPAYRVLKGVKAFLSLILAVTTFVVAIYLAYANYQVIAAGLDELQVAQWAFYSMLQLDLSNVYMAAGYPGNFKPLNNMSYPMVASFFLMFVHIVVALLDGIHAALRYIEKEIDKKEGIDTSIKKEYVDSRIKSSVSYEEEAKKDLTGALQYILEKAGSRNQKKNAKSLAETIKGDIDNNTTTAELVPIVNSIVFFYKEFKLLFSSEGSKLPNKDKLVAENVRKAREFFRKSYADGGLEVSVSRD